MSFGMRKSGGLAWLAVGFLGGVLAAGFWPHTPLHADATDRYESFAIATGKCDETLEAIYFLDFLTGDLSAVVIGKQPTGPGFLVTGYYYANVMKYLNVDPAKNPRFLMVTGLANLTRGGRGGAVMPSRAVVYVAEVTTGRCAAYAIPWNATAHARGQVDKGALVPVAAFPFRSAAAPGAGGGKAKG